MSFDKLIEEKIREAMNNGEFDNLPGKGKPLDLQAYFDTPEDVRITNSLLKSAGFIPEEAQLLKEVESLKAALENCSNGEERNKIKKLIDEKKLKINLLIEQRRTRLRAKF